MKAKFPKAIVTLLVLLSFFSTAQAQEKKEASKTSTEEEKLITQALIKHATPNTRVIVIDLTAQMCSVLDIGPNFSASNTDDIKEVFLKKCTSGRSSAAGGDNRPTPTTVTEDNLGYTTVVGKEEDGYSDTFKSPMPYELQLGFKDKDGKLRGISIHQGLTRNYPASHACVRLEAKEANKLFELIEIGTRVFVYGSALEYQKREFDVDGLLAYPNKRPVFKAVLPGATEADKDLLLSYFKSHKLQIDYRGRNGKVSTDKSHIRFRLETMPHGTGITVADFEEMFGYEIHLKPPVVE